VDRRHGLIARPGSARTRSTASAVRSAIAVMLAACGGPPAPRRPAGSAVEVLARGTLGYAVAFAGERVLSVELGETFELVVRGAGPAQRVALGGADRDWVALATAGERAWVGGETGEVVEIDLAAAEIVARWPVGAPVTALAASEEFVAIGDAEGALCLRRADDGALLQCVAAHAGAIRDLAVDGEVVTSRGDDGAHGWTLPALAEIAPAADATIRANGLRVDRLTEDGPQLVVEMAGQVQDVAIAASGRVAVAAWIRALDQASIVVVTPIGGPIADTMAP